MPVKIKYLKLFPTLDWNWSCEIRYWSYSPSDVFFFCSILVPIFIKRRGVDDLTDSNWKKAWLFLTRAERNLNEPQWGGLLRLCPHSSHTFNLGEDIGEKSQQQQQQLTIQLWRLTMRARPDLAAYSGCCPHWSRNSRGAKFHACNFTCMKTLWFRLEILLLLESYCILVRKLLYGLKNWIEKTLIDGGINFLKRVDVRSVPRFKVFRKTFWSWFGASISQSVSPLFFLAALCPHRKGIREEKKKNEWSKVEWRPLWRSQWLRPRTTEAASTVNLIRAQELRNATFALPRPNWNPLEA